MFKAFEKLLVPLAVIGIVTTLIAGHLAAVVVVSVGVGVSLTLIFFYNIRSGGNVWERSNDRHRRRDSRGLITGLLCIGLGLLLWRLGATELRSIGVLLIVALVLFGIFVTTVSPAKSGSKK